jgi:hypothetical protein
MYRFATGGPIDVEELRERFRRMTNDQLLRYEKTAAYMCTPKANLDHPPREAFLVQLGETRSEWRRRKCVSATEVGELRTSRDALPKD